ncbi:MULTISPECIES: tetratricopeptide repeat protein [unclassified Maridesulfovibrio]|uniref:tetratricopeptide repeat protein n=1 Tax=unclassified Maridesulfovibrio TaxID=2794999 RepID=UPI003B3D36E8
MSSPKSIKENIARAKSYGQRKDYMRCLHALSLSLDELASSQVFGREKFEIGILIDEVFRQLLAMEELKRVLPRGLKYVKGQEKKLAAMLMKIHDTIKNALEKAAVEKVRKQKNQIDKFVLAGQKFLMEKNVKEAKKYFRKITEAFPEERGLLQDVGSRLVKSGFPADGVEYLERAIEKTPSDSRPYISILLAYEMMTEQDKALEIIKDIVRRFGANESIYIRQAKLFLGKRMYTEAYDAAAAALKVNPLNREAKKISDKLGPKIFGRGYTPGATASDMKAKSSAGGAKGKKESVSFNIDGSSSGEKKDKAAKKKAPAKKPAVSKAIKLDF